MKLTLLNRPNPQVRNKKTTAWIMRQVLIALCFPSISAIYFFGMQALINLLFSMLCAIIFEALYQYFAHQKITIHDGSAAVSGLLLGLSLVVTVPWWIIVVGNFIAIVVIKQFLGKGLGKNMFNPAVAGRVGLKIFFTPWITGWVLPLSADMISTATPLKFIGNKMTEVLPNTIPSLTDLFFGFNLGGNIGDTSKFAILLGGLYLVFRGVINLKLPIVTIVTVMLCFGLASNMNLELMLAHALSGTLFFAAFFMVTDYVSGALTPDGQTVFAIGVGFLTFVLRFFLNYPGGIGIAILIMNAFVPLIDKTFAPRIYGTKARVKA